MKMTEIIGAHDDDVDIMKMTMMLVMMLVLLTWLMIVRV